MPRRKVVGPQETDLAEPASSNGLTVDTAAASKELVDAGIEPSGEPVQINNHNLTELKNTLDDALKRVS